MHFITLKTTHYPLQKELIIIMRLSAILSKSISDTNLQYTSDKRIEGMVLSVGRTSQVANALADTKQQKPH